MPATSYTGVSLHDSNINVLKVVFPLYIRSRENFHLAYASVERYRSQALVKTTPRNLRPL